MVVPNITKMVEILVNLAIYEGISHVLLFRRNYPSFSFHSLQIEVMQQHSSSEIILNSENVLPIIALELQVVKKLGTVVYLGRAFSIPLGDILTHNVLQLLYRIASFLVYSDHITLQGVELSHLIQKHILYGNLQSKIARSSERWGKATTGEQDHNVHTKPPCKQCFILRSSPYAIYSPCCLCCSGNFTLLVALTTFF